jgi:hypothetical protein
VRLDGSLCFHFNAHSSRKTNQNPRSTSTYSDTQNEDGGYSFARGAESSAADTYYGIQILRMLGAEPRNAVKTINFMKGLQREDGSFDSVNVAYDVVKTLDELGARLQRPLEDLILSLQTAHGGFGYQYHSSDKITPPVRSGLVDAWDFLRSRLHTTAAELRMSTNS